MKNWMKELADHFEAARKRHPDDKLMVLFDVDGTILDTRYTIVFMLKAYDRQHDTQYFNRLKIKDVKGYHDDLDELLADLNISEKEREKILSWSLQNRWSPETVLASHWPFSGVLEVIRWFQLQPNVEVGINTGFPKSLKKNVLNLLNALGEQYRVHFDAKHIHMHEGEWGQQIAETKVKGLKFFQKKGYRIFAVVDNEPANLKAISEADQEQDILLLHASTIFKTRRTRKLSRVVSGKEYDLTELIAEHHVPQHIQLVWHGLNTASNLRQFLASEVRWGEVDVIYDPASQEPVIRHDHFRERVMHEDESLLELDEVLKRIGKAGRAIKLDFKEGGPLIDSTLELVKKLGFKDEDLWFNGYIERIDKKEFRRIAKAYPKAINQCIVNFIAPLVIGAKDKALDLLKMMNDWGINRFAFNWKTLNKAQLLDQMEAWGYEVNFYKVPDLSEFLQAVLLNPTAITTDFNFPKWHYYGQGSGEHRQHHEYSMQPKIHKSVLD